jgi:hypothetical protein
MAWDEIIDPYILWKQYYASFSFVNVQFREFGN